MSRLSIHTEIYPTFRLAGCCLCTQPYQEQYVAEILFLDDNLLGEICPRCLNRHPAEVASGLLIRRSGVLRDLFNHIRNRSAAIREESMRIRADSEEARQKLRRTIAESKRLVRGKSTGTTKGEAIPNFVEELSVLERWPLSLDQLIETERSVIRQKYAFLKESELALLVDDRYKAMLH